MTCTNSLRETLDTAVNEFKQLEQQFNQLQTELIRRSGSIETLQQLIQNQQMAEAAQTASEPEEMEDDG